MATCNVWNLWHVTNCETSAEWQLIVQSNSIPIFGQYCTASNLGDPFYLDILNLIPDEYTANLINFQVQQNNLSCIQQQLQDIQTVSEEQLDDATGEIIGSVNDSTYQVLFWLDILTGAVSQQVLGSELSVRNVVQAAQSIIQGDIAVYGQWIVNNIISENDVLRSELDYIVNNASNNLATQAAINQQTADRSHGIILDTIGQGIENLNQGIDGIEMFVTTIFGDTLGDIAEGFAWFGEKYIKPITDGIGNLVSKFGHFVDDIIDDLFLRLIKGIETFNIFSNTFLGILEEKRQEILDLQADLIDGKIDSWFQLENKIHSIMGDTGFIKTLFFLWQFFPMMKQLNDIFMYPAMANLQLLANEEAGVNILSENMVLEAFKRGNIDVAKSIKELGMLGYSGERSYELLELIKNLFDVGDIRQLFLRDFISEEHNDKLLSQLGYTPEDSELLKKLYQVLPTVQDLVLMAVREVFTPDVAAKFGLFEDFPPEFLQHAKQIGLSEEWAKNYWGAHWQLPSTFHGYIMYHRGVIDLDELNLLLRTQDVMPYWRDKLIQIAFNPLTRVDVRRMHKVGVLSRSQVYRSYQDLGYNPHNAELMTEFTLRYNADVGENGLSQIKELTRSVIQSAYNKGAIDRQDAQKRLHELGYTIEDTELLLDMLDIDRQLELLPDDTKDLTIRLNNITIKAYTARAISKKEATVTLQESGYTLVEIEAILTISDLEHDIDLKAQIVSELKGLYYEETIDVLDLRVILEANDFSTGEIDRIVNELDIFKLLRGRNLTRADLRNAFRGNVISLEEYIKELGGLGYASKYIAIILANDNIPI